jgi:hypothetical protein
MSERGKKIIVIGDWFIDENWLISRQKLYHSSHTGDIHFRARHEKFDRRIISLCGAAILLEVLRSYFHKKNDHHYEFIGLGLWNTEDNDVMQCTLCQENTENKLLTPFTLVSLKKVEKSETTRICPYKCGHESECDYHINLRNLAKEEAKTSTNRIIRCYEGFRRGEPHLLYRFDWILPIHPSKDLDYNWFTTLDQDGIEAIIIEDHGMGVINEECIKELVNIGQNSLWFIRTKIDNPPWMKILLDSRIKPELIISDYQLARYKKGERRWWYGKELSRASLELLGEMTGAHYYKHGVRRPYKGRVNSKRAAVLLDNNTVLAKHDNYCFGIHQAPGKKQIINIGRTSIFYAALIAQLLYEKQENGRNFKQQCNKALTCAYRWCKEASKKWTSEERLHFFFGDYSKALSNLEEIKSPGTTEVDREKFDVLWERWNRSSVDEGVISPNTDRKNIELWRGEGTLPGYICVGGPKRNAINRLVSSIASFNNTDSPRLPLGCLLTASPGWGKSFLAKCIANYFNMEFLDFSIAQMSTSRDLIDCLATISSVQNRTQKRTLIFIDEINAQIEGHDVISLLLGPLWDGIFLMDGRSYRLRPGVWVFASTDRVDRIIESHELLKGSDFISRLNGPIIELDSLAAGENLANVITEVRKYIIQLEGKSQRERRGNIYNIYQDDMSKYSDFVNIGTAELKTEQIYIMTTLLIKYWGPINKIQHSVLKLFHDILPINGIRSLEFFASSFKEVSDGRIIASNVPIIEKEDALRRHIIYPMSWLEKPPDWEGGAMPPGWWDSRGRYKNYKEPESENDFVHIETVNM